MLTLVNRLLIQEQSEFSSYKFKRSVRVCVCACVCLPVEITGIWCRYRPLGAFCFDNTTVGFSLFAFLRQITELEGNKIEVEWLNSFRVDTSATPLLLPKKKFGV